MNEEQKEWYKQYTASFGVRELFRLGFCTGAWMFLAVVAAAFFNFSEIFSGFVFIIFLATLFAFAIASGTWGPAYLLLRKILGNKNLPAGPYPRSTIKIQRLPRPRYGYLPAIWQWLLGLALLYAVIRYLSK